jgi:hypothetical protein
MASETTDRRTMSRRDLMRRVWTAALGGAAAAATGSLLLARTADASGALTLGDRANASTAPTGLAVSDPSPSYGLGVTDHGLDAVPETASLFGHAKASYDDAVLGFHEGKDGYGAKGLATGEAGTGVWGAAPGSGGVGVEGTGQRVGVAGLSASMGVYGTGGRGGVFQGTDAAVRFVPAGSTGHPTRGQRGDLVVDKGGRLWFCKGGASWKQIA